MQGFCFTYLALLMDKVTAVRPGHLFLLPAAGSLNLNCVIYIIKADVLSAQISIKIPFTPTSQQHFTCEKRFRLEHRGEIVNGLDAFKLPALDFTLLKLFTNYCYC